MLVMEFFVGVEATLQVDGQEDADAVEELLDVVVDHLLDQQELLDPSWGLNRSTFEVEFEGVITAADHMDAQHRFSIALRCALHAAGVGTPTWPTAAELATELQQPLERNALLVGSNSRILTEA